jgi:hypothetical protein
MRAASKIEGSVNSGILKKCQRFTSSLRREVLSFSHHKEVASLPEDEANKYLDWAENEGSPISKNKLNAK